MCYDTIVAISTPKAIGAVSIVRVSGDKALQVAKQITKKSSLVPRYATLCKLFDSNDELLDEAVVIYFQAPHSYTGEDVVEFQCHGGLIVANMVLKTVLGLDVSLAMPGEFSKRAYINGKMDLSQVQAVSNIIKAQSESAVKVLSRQISGELAEFVRQNKASLVEVLAFIEVGIDYGDEPIDDSTTRQIEDKLEVLKNSMTKLLQNSTQKDGLMQGFYISIIGKPNVGKSSFLNALLCENAVIVSNEPGTTRDTITKAIKIGDNIVHISDTAGIRQTTNDIEAKGIKMTKQTFANSDIVVAMFDNSSKLDDDDKYILNLVKNTDKIVIKILNKIDLKNKLDKDKIGNHIAMSVEKNADKFIDKLQEILTQSFDSSQLSLVSSRQIEATKKCLANIVSSQKSSSSNDMELLSFELNEALKNISSITEPYSHDQMLDVMFGEFCLGK